MTVNWKPALIIIGVLSTMMLILLVTSKVILLASFARLEEEDVRENVLRARNALSDELAGISRTTGDYAAWDDSYDFIVKPGKKYIRNNLGETTFTGLRLNLIVFVKRSGQIVFSKAFDFTSLKTVPAPEYFSKSLDTKNPLLQHDTSDSSRTGIVLLPQGPMLIVAHPILPSDKNGTSRGTLIMGRYLDAVEVAKIANTTHLALEIQQIDNKLLSLDYQLARTSLTQNSSIFVKPLSEKYIAGFSLLQDIYGEPLLVLRSTLPRSLYQQGRNTITYFLLWILSFTLLFGGATYHFFNRYLMVQNKRLESEKRYRAVVEQASEGIILFDSVNQRIVETNGAFLQMLGLNNGNIQNLNLYDIAGSDQRVLNSIVQRVLSKNRPVLEELCFLRKDGSEIYVEMSANHIFFEGKKQICAVIHDITQRKRTEERLTKLNECFLGFTSNPDENIQHLTALCGELMHAACALYNRLGDGLLHIMAQWQPPPDFNPVDRPDGHICHDVIMRGGNSIYVARDLPNTPYAVSDPNVMRYNLKTYIGVPVKCRGNSVGSLCVVYQQDFSPTEEERKLMGILAVAIEVAEESKQAAEVLRESDVLPVQHWRLFRNRLPSSTKMDALLPSINPGGILRKETRWPCKMPPKG